MYIVCMYMYIYWFVYTCTYIVISCTCLYSWAKPTQANSPVMPSLSVCTYVTPIYTYYGRHFLIFPLKGGGVP